ncbi:MAG: hypothetical protein PHV05_01790, partial [Candidatus Riflebacteria bacterium]|nr:hypothetical protein [Candidatus Riflebacteria bacterium]
IVEELENRSDVAVTVLFHDPEAVVKETPVHTASISAIDVLASKKSLESEVSTDKKEVSNANSKRYEELRRRVYAATKSVYSRLDGSPQIARIK